MSLENIHPVRVEKLYSGWKFKCLGCGFVATFLLDITGNKSVFKVVANPRKKEGYVHVDEHNVVLGVNYDRPIEERGVDRARRDFVNSR